MSANARIALLLAEIGKGREVLDRIDAFDFQYDWDRLEFLRLKYERMQPRLAVDLDRFVAFLRELAT